MSLHEVAYWFFVGSLVWTATVGVLVLFLMGAHRDDDDL
jgi:hypothetical protein